MDIIIWGLGERGKAFMRCKYLYKNDEIVAFVDNNAEYWGKRWRWGGDKYKNLSVLNPMQISDMIYDRVVICVEAYSEIKTQLINELHVDPKKIFIYYDIENEFKARIFEKYASSLDKQVLKVLEHFREKGVNVFGYYEGERKEFEVHYDDSNNEYVLMNNKKMYIPEKYPIYKKDGKCHTFLGYELEQRKGSPHLYIKRDTDVKEQAVIVDAGACEGYFALQYIERAKKVYLIEPDLSWMESLKRTFAPYKDKVVFCNKFLTRYDSKNTITLDTLVKEQIDFLKMDIEGSEIDALLGGKKVLKNSDARCAICSYHKQNDEENIRMLLELYGYDTAVSEGYMFFIYDDNIADTLDLRRGIVYGKKK